MIRTTRRSPRSLRSWPQVLLLAFLCATLGVSQIWAGQAPLAASAAPEIQAVQAAPSPAAAGSALPADLLERLSAAPVSASTSCTTTAQCPTGQLCCLACGFFGCTAKACFPPMNGHCPLFP